MRYRIWHIKRKEMFVVKMLEFNNEGLKNIRIIGQLPGTSGYIKIPTDFMRAEQGIVMSTANVIDMEGNELFDGDLIEVVRGADPTRSNYMVVQFSKHRNAFNIRQPLASRSKLIGNRYQDENLYKDILKLEGQNA